MTGKTPLSYETVAAELMESDGDPDLHLVLLSLLSKGSIVASRNADGEIVFHTDGRQ